MLLYLIIVLYGCRVAKWLQGFNAFLYINFNYHRYITPDSCFQYYIIENLK